MNTQDTPAVRIASRRDGFRRVGMAHPAAAVIHPAGTFTQEQIDALCAEPELMVDVDPATDTGTGAAAQPALPDPDAFRTARIDAAIVGLDPGDKSAWTKGKEPRPTASAIAAASGLADVSAAERDERWARVRAFALKVVTAPAGGEGGKDPAGGEGGKDPAGGGASGDGAA